MSDMVEARQKMGAAYRRRDPVAMGETRRDFEFIVLRDLLHDHTGKMLIPFTAAQRGELLRLIRNAGAAPRDAA